MVSKFRPASSAGESPQALIALLIPIWPRVEALELYKLRHRAEPEHLGTLEITHIEDAQPPDMPNDDAMAAIQFCEEDAKHQGARGRYKIVIKGMIPAVASPLQKRGKERAPPAPLFDQVLNTWTFSAGEASSAGGGEDTPIRQVTDFVKEVPKIYGGVMDAVARSQEIVGTNQLMLQADNATLRQQVGLLEERAQASQEWNFKTVVVQLEAEVAERAALREEQMQHRRLEFEAQMSERNSQVLLTMVATAKDIAMMILALKQGETIAKDRRDARAEARAAGVDPDVAEAEADVGTIPRQLHEVIASLTPEEAEKLKEAMGSGEHKKKGRHDVWDLIVGASKVGTDQEAMALLKLIKVEFRHDKVKYTQAITSAQALLGMRFAQLLTVLTSAGVLESDS